MRQVKKAFGTWRAAGAAIKREALPEVAPPPAGWIGRVHLDEPGPTEIALGWPLSLSRSHEDWTSLALVDASLRARLAKTAPARTLVDVGEMPGPFLLRASAEPKRADGAVDSLRAALGALAKDGLTEDELSAAKAWTAGDLARRFETNPSICDFYAEVEHARLGVDYARRLSAQLRSATLVDVNRAASNHIRTDGAAVTAGPKK